MYLFITILVGPGAALETVNGKRNDFTPTGEPFIFTGDPELPYHFFFFFFFPSLTISRPLLYLRGTSKDGRTDLITWDFFLYSHAFPKNYPQIDLGESTPFYANLSAIVHKDLRCFLVTPAKSQTAVLGVVHHPAFLSN